jgi:hypothetical protein
MEMSADSGRFCGDYEISNVQLKSSNTVNADELVIPDNYTRGAIVAGYSADKTTPHYAWSDLVDGEKHAFLTGTTADKNWYYDAASNSVIVTKTGTKGYGAMNFLIANPLYGKQESFNGEKAVFEFTMNMLDMDTNNDGNPNTVADICKTTASSVWGQINIGYGDGIYDYTRAFNDGGAASRTISGIMANTGLLGNFRIAKTNSATATTKNLWGLGYYNQTSDGGNYVSNIPNGVALTLKFVVTVDKTTGKPSTLEIYGNGTKFVTRTNESGNTTGFTWCKDGFGAHDNFFNAPYFEISQFIRADGYQSTSFSNFSSWSE